MTNTPSSAARDTARPRVVPKGWIPLKAAIAWIAFRTAESDLDEAFYFGASQCFITEPAAIAHDLRAIAEKSSERVSTWVHMQVDHLARLRIGKGEKPRQGFEDRPITAADRATAARDLLQEMGDLAEAEAKYEALWRASETLRQAIADGRLVAYGRQNGPEQRGRSSDGRRKRIPAEVCAAALVIMPDGITRPPRNDDPIHREPLAWCDVEIHAVNLMDLWPVPASTAPIDTASGDVPKGGKRGPRPHPMRETIMREWKKRNGPPAQQMKDFADTLLKQQGRGPPSVSAISKWIADARRGP